MGCLKNIFMAVLITLAAVGFISLGGGKLVGGYLDNFLNPPQDELLKRAEKVGDFSKISDEFELERAAGVMGYNGVVAEHKATGQKMIVVDEQNKPLITKEDIKSEKIDEKLNNLTKKVKYQSLQVDDLKITKRGTLKSYGKDAPYVKFEAKARKLPIGDVAGIISVAETKDGEQRLLISVNERKKYSQLIADEFFKGIK